jgi:hypothetical protein
MTNEGENIITGICKMRWPYTLIVLEGGNFGAVLMALVKVVAPACNTSCGRSHRGVETRTAIFTVIALQIRLSENVIGVRVSGTKAQHQDAALRGKGHSLRRLWVMRSLHQALGYRMEGMVSADMENAPAREKHLRKASFSLAVNKDCLG